MKRRSTLGFLFLATALVAVGVVGVGSQCLETIMLRAELAQVRGEEGELERLRETNKRLRLQQISAAELESLHADHAALQRLRVEIEALNKR